MPIKRRTEIPLSTGLPRVDELIGGLQVGDNVVWQVIGPLQQTIISSFVSVPSTAPLVYVTFTERAFSLLRKYRSQWRDREVLIIDCVASAAASSGKEEVGRHETRLVEDPTNPSQVVEALDYAEDLFGPGAAYMFDNLTAIQDAWGPEEALNLFLEHCPRLYELRTVAYWLLRKEAHDASFLARLQRTTQVVFETGPSNGNHLLRVVKAAGRNDAVGRVVEIAVEEGRFTILAEKIQEPARSGELLKAQRLARSLSQAELARRLGITPSALSQAETGVRDLSEETLLSAYAVLGAEQKAPSLPYALARRRARRSLKLAAGLRGEPVFEDSSRMSVHILEFAPRASGRRAPFATKQKELVVLMSGVLELHIGAATEVLQAGDAILLREEPAGSWSNPGSSPARALWCILPPTGK